jgi:3-oxoacyl-[acyl-carrier protein] reductase
VDILINNAGVNILAYLGEIDPSNWQALLQINLNSALRLIQAFAPGMQRRGWGRILNISSILGLVARPRRSAYSMTKAALDALTRSAAVELGPSGILVNSLSPGYVDTELTRRNNSSREILEIAASIPLRRLAEVEELARVAAFLVSDENTYLTGQNIVVDGGFICQ